MTNTEQILDAINTIAVEKIPGLEFVYLELEPQNVERPCLLVESVTTSINDASHDLVRCPSYFTVTGYTKTDSHGRSDTKELLRMQTDILNLFRGGTLKVGNRALRVSASTGGKDWDRVYVDVQLDFYDDRRLIEEPRDDMGSLDITTKMI